MVNHNGVNMSKRVILPVLAFSLSGAGFLAVNHWLVTSSDMSTPLIQPNAVPIASDAGQKPTLSHTKVMTVQPNTVANVVTANYPIIDDLGTLSLYEIAERYALNDLPLANGRLVMNHRTRTMVEDVVLALPREEILRNKSRLEQAVALRHGSQVAVEFSSVLLGFIHYKDAITAIDNKRNASGFTSANANDNNLLRQRLQNEAFGKEKSAQLFQVERETLAVLSKQSSELKASGEELNSEQRERMKAEFADILQRDERR